jgi:tetratricopeptide (TPR) repeat protein
VVRRNGLALALLNGLFRLGLPLTGRGGYDQALTTFTEALARAEKLGGEIFRNRFLNCLGWVHAECGNLERAIELNQRGADMSRERGDAETIVAYRLNGNLELAREYFESAYGLVRKPSNTDWAKWRYSQHLFAGLGELWLASDDPGKAEGFCNQCLDLATGTESRKYLVLGWRLRGEIAKVRLHWEEAEEALRKALTYAKRVGNPTQLWKTHLTLGQLYRDTRRIDGARSSFAAARQVIDGIGQSLQTAELKDGFDCSPIFQKAYEQIQTD